MQEKAESIYRAFKAFLLLAAAVVLCWRGTTFVDTSGNGVIPTAMCLGMAVCLGLVAMSITMRSTDSSSQA
jgi:hypothetical protein